MLGFPVNIAIFLRIAFLYNTSGGCFWQSYQGRVKSARCLFFDFSPPHSFNFDEKHSWNVAQTMYYPVSKQFLFCLNWLVTCFWFQNMFWKNINCLQFWKRTYTKHCTSNCVNVCTLWLVRCFQFQGMI